MFDEEAQEGKQPNDSRVNISENVLSELPCLKKLVKMIILRINLLGISNVSWKF